MSIKKIALFASLPLIFAGHAFAYEQGDWVIKAGAANVDPKSDSGIQGVTVEDDTQLGLTITYMLKSQLGLELLASTPFDHDITVAGSTVGSAKHLPPTLSVQYYPLSPESALQPYVGLGVNYTIFFDESGIVEDLDNSLGMSYSAGVNYDINETMLVNFSVWKIDIESELNGSGVDVEIDPTVMSVNVGYRF